MLRYAARNDSSILLKCAIRSHFKGYRSQMTQSSKTEYEASKIPALKKAMEKAAEEKQPGIENKEPENQVKNEENRNPGDQELIPKVFVGVSKGVPKYIKGLRFKKFVEKMEYIYLSELRWQRKLDKLKAAVSAGIFVAKNPLHEALRAYQKNNSAGFSSENLATCIQTLSDVFKCRGTKPKPYYDYTRTELISSWQMYHVLDDIKHGLKLSTMFLPYNMARVLLNSNLT